MTTLYNIKDCLQDLPEIMEMIYQEWGQFFKKPAEQKKQEITNAINSKCDFPQIYVIKQNNIVIGGFIIKDKDLENCDLSPWVACVVVKKEYRGKGYGRQLLLHLEQVCNLYPQIYLFTTLKNFYEKIGFEYIKDINHNGEINKLYIRKTKVWSWKYNNIMIYCIWKTIASQKRGKNG